jgi:hypothetical protein
MPPWLKSKIFSVPEEPEPAPSVTGTRAAASVKVSEKYG